ncbi:rhodanese-like domain-containing protein [uncultured Aeromicrobium sp.]|uniref:rhodanese-like domain-containing protein n=1 Tax=uncultured Aeromicrobium sp. TaxID=337820 RepID=UPI0025E70F74|nr:rhodanese-like domain-containing protein [uncultured Aeromicrobium sp.]
MNDFGVPSVSVSDLPDPLPESIVVLDVREPDEWAAGHLEKAVHIPLGSLAHRVDELDPEAETVVMCHLGGRSARATAWLASHGHRVVNLEGGIEAWQAAGRPVVRD